MHTEKMLAFLERNNDKTMEYYLEEFRDIRFQLEEPEISKALKVPERLPFALGVEPSDTKSLCLYINRDAKIDIFFEDRVKRVSGILIESEDMFSEEEILEKMDLFIVSILGKRSTTKAKA